MRHRFNGTLAIARTLVSDSTALTVPGDPRTVLSCDWSVFRKSPFHLRSFLAGLAGFVAKHSGHGRIVDRANAIRAIDPESLWDTHRPHQRSSARNLLNDSTRTEGDHGVSVGESLRKSKGKGEEVGV